MMKTSLANVENCTSNPVNAEKSAICNTDPTKPETSKTEGEREMCTML